MAIDVIICHSATAFDVSAKRRIEGLISLGVVFRFWVFQYDVPSVYQAGNIAETTEGNVDDRIGGAQSNFDPDCFSMP